MYDSGTCSRSSSCTIKYYKAYTVYVSSNSSCGYVEIAKDESGSYVRHFCHLRHSSCGLGMVRDCDLDYD